MKIENLSTLIINKLTQEQYNRELENGNIDDNQIYLIQTDDVVNNLEVELYKLTAKVNQQEVKIQDNREHTDSIVGNLSDYWNVGLQVADVMSAINANASWVNGTFEPTSNKIQNIFNHSADETKYPSAKATYDLMKFVYDLVMPVKIYDDPTGFEANNKDVGNWQLNNLDLTPYKRLKFYVKAGGDGNDNRTVMHVVEMHLDDRCKNSIGFTAGHTAVNPNNKNRIHCVTFAVNEAKTAIQFVVANSLYGTASTSSSGGRYCYLIEGYYI